MSNLPTIYKYMLNGAWKKYGGCSRWIVESPKCLFVWCLAVTLWVSEVMDFTAKAYFVNKIDLIINISFHMEWEYMVWIFQYKND